MKVYKYRGGSPDILSRDLESIVNNFFWAPTVDQLNDPTEAYVNDRDVLNMLALLGAKNVEESIRSLLKMRHIMGVYSLSKNPLDELMWAYYADSHKGFCIEYDLDRLVLEARTAWNVINVVYRPIPSTIMFDDILHDMNESLFLEKMSATKSCRWAHEEEVRIITTVSGRNNYAPAAIKGIYFGCNCDDKFISKVRKDLQGRDIKFYKIEFSADSYSMKPNELQYDEYLDGERIKYFSPLDEGAVPKLKDVSEKNRIFYSCIEKAIDLVRCDSSCEKIVWVDFSSDKTKAGKPVIYVHYKTNVITQFDSTVTQYFPVVDLQS